FPSAIHLAATNSVVNDLIPSLQQLAKALRKKQRQFKDVVKSGRTHLMDATPVTLGQEFGGYATAIEHGIERLEAALPRLAELPLGGTATGTGINAPKGFARAVIKLLAEELELPLTEARDHFEAQGARDALVETSGMLRVIADSLVKICNDLRWMGSGPRAGLAEIRIPDLQPGSSIMPGKVNPVIPEAVMQVDAQGREQDPARGDPRRGPYGRGRRRPRPRRGGDDAGRNPLGVRPTGERPRRAAGRSTTGSAAASNSGSSRARR